MRKKPIKLARVSETSSRQLARQSWHDICCCCNHQTYLIQRVFIRNQGYVEQAPNHYTNNVQRQIVLHIFPRVAAFLFVWAQNDQRVFLFLTDTAFKGVIATSHGVPWLSSTLFEWDSRDLSFVCVIPLTFHEPATLHHCPTSMECCKSYYDVCLSAMTLRQTEIHRLMYSQLIWVIMTVSSSCGFRIPTLLSDAHV